MSTRGRLTVAYATLLLGTLIVFAVAIATVRGSRSDEVGAEAQREADSLVATIRGRQVAVSQFPDSQLTVWLTQIGGDTTTQYARPTQVLIDLLNRVPGYFLVFNNQGQLLFASQPMRALSLDDQDAVEAVAARLASGIEGAVVSLRPQVPRLYMFAEQVPTPAMPVPNIARVVVGVPTTFAELLAPTLLGTIVVATPIIFLLSLIVAYAVLGNIFRPVDDLINEVEAITDGRSLHRRLPTESSNDELARLSTTLNAMLSRLETSFSALRRFTADASHELKTPLTVLRADVERAMHPESTRGERLIALEEALQETARMADLVDGLLTLARADEGRFDIHREPVELEPLVREVFETAVILGEDAGLTLSLSALDGCVVMGDRTRLRQLLLNLVTNAIKYTPRGGKVEMAVLRRPHDEVTIVVRDTGIGIAATDLPHIFERFWRADRARSRASERGGFGLGLAIAQWIVQAHGGSISVQSRLGRGTAFSVLLPVVSDEAAGEAVEHETDEPAAESQA